MSRARVIICAKRTAYRRFVEEEQDPRVRALIKKRDPSVAHWVEAHREHMRTLDSVVAALNRLGVHVVLLERAHVAFDTTDAALVVTVGGDGTLLAASHNVGSAPILGVNSAPRTSVGFFCAATRQNVGPMLEGALNGKLARVVLARMAVKINGRIRSQRVLNEALYSHSSPAATSRYILRTGNVREEQRSSGFWIGPAAGSTAAQRSAGGRILPLTSRKLQLVVREPFLPGSAHAGFRGPEPSNERLRLLRVLVPEGSRLEAQSKMQDASVYLDGPYTRVSVRLGDTVSFQISDDPLTVCGLSRRRGS